MRKYRRISGRKKPPQKALAFFFGSARVGIVTSPALAVSVFLEARLLAGFLFVTS
jgi:hypothetical protein